MTMLQTPSRAQAPDPLNTSNSLLNTTNSGGSLLLSPASPSSPHSAKICIRNQLLAAVEQVRDLLHLLRTSTNVVDLAGLPPLTSHSIEECLDGVVQWISDAGTFEALSEMDIREAIVKLDDEMNACGVTLYLEALTRVARQDYKTVLDSFYQWLNTTQHKTGEDQPLTEPERAIMLDFAEVELRWAENESNIIAPRQEFLERTLAMRELRNEHAERLARNESVQGIRGALSDGSSARRRQLFKHVANRAAMLRHVPKEHLSSRQRRDSRDTANAVMRWIDEHAADGSLDDLADYLQRVCETAQVVSAAADTVARYNELDQLLSFIRSCITVRKEIMESLGDDALQGLAFVVGKTEYWLKEHPNPTIAALEKFIEGLRLACQRYGLSCPAVDDAVVPPPGVATTKNGPSSSNITGVSKEPSAAEVAQEAAAEVAKVVVPHDPLLITHIACAILEELLVLRVACRAAGATSFIARHIAPLQVEVEHVLGDDLALKDGAASLLKRYKAVLQAATTDCQSMRVPSSCWTRVLPFDDIEIGD